MLFKECGTGSTRCNTHLTETLRFSTFQILFVLSSAAELFMQMLWYCCLCAYTPLVLWGKVSFGINSLSQQGYARDQLSCFSCALNFNNPPNSEAQQPAVPKLCWPVDKNQLLTTWNPTGPSWFSREAQPTFSLSWLEDFWSLASFAARPIRPFAL